MSVRTGKSTRGLIGAQILGSLFVIALVALAPPAEGNMLLIPLAGQSQGQLVNLAVTQGALPVQRGPIGASVIVYGTRGQIMGPLLRAGVLVLAGGAVGCRSTKGNAA
jgi:hypothetical protein